MYFILASNGLHQTFLDPRLNTIRYTGQILKHSMYEYYMISTVFFFEIECNNLMYSVFQAF